MVKKRGKGENAQGGTWSCLPFRGDSRGRVLTELGGCHARREGRGDKSQNNALDIRGSPNPRNPEKRRGNLAKKQSFKLRKRVRGEGMMTVGEKKQKKP